MKILFSHYKHFTEVIFPTLWPNLSIKQIQEVLCAYLGINKPPIRPLREFISASDLKLLVLLCWDIVTDKDLLIVVHLTAMNDSINNPPLSITDPKLWQRLTPCYPGQSKSGDPSQIGFHYAKEFGILPTSPISDIKLGSFSNDSE